MITDLMEAKRLFEEDRQAAQTAYEVKIEEMRLQYEQVKLSTLLYFQTFLLYVFLQWYLP